jgi:hypothetical protein
VIFRIGLSPFGYPLKIPESSGIASRLPKKVAERRSAMRAELSK